MIEAGGPVIQGRAEGNHYSIFIESSGEVVTQWRSASRAALWSAIVICWLFALGSLALLVVAPEAKWYFPIVIFITIFLMTYQILFDFPRYINITNDHVICFVVIDKSIKFKIDEFYFIISESSLNFARSRDSEGNDIYEIWLKCRGRKCLLFRGFSPNEIKAHGRYLAEKMGLAYIE